MEWKAISGFIFFILVVILLAFYWIIPLDETNFLFNEKNYNFSLGLNETMGMQFYSHMRFPNPAISYRIEDCPLNKKEDMERAFEIVGERTILDFEYVDNNEEIMVTCDSKTKIEGRFFIAGEGGPTNITQTSNFNVIKNGAITLIRESQCPEPNVGIHELFHVLGFDHSTNPNNIMYGVSKCDQEISQDMIDVISNLYSYPSHVDLSLENVSAVMRGKYLDVNFTVTNNGLKNSEESVVKIYADGKPIKEFQIEGLEIGFGRKIMLKNIFVFQLRVDELKFSLVYDEPELNKQDNEIMLDVKK